MEFRDQGSYPTYRCGNTRSLNCAVPRIKPASQSSRCSPVGTSTVTLKPFIHPDPPFLPRRKKATTKILAIQIHKLPQKQRFLAFFFFLTFLVPHLQHIEVPRLGVKSELQPPTETTATRDPIRICDPHHSSWQCQILNPLSEDLQ